MARSFASASLQYFLVGSAISGTEPLSIAARFKAANTTASCALAGFGSSGTGNQQALSIRGNIAGDPVSATSNDGAASNADSASAYSAGVWSSAVAVFAATNSRAIAFNGAAFVTDTTTRTPTVNRTAIGARIQNGSPTNLMDGDICEVAIWNLALAQDDADMYNMGYSPLMIKPWGLIGYWPLFGRAGTGDEEDWVGANPMVAQAAPAVSDHPPQLIYPPARKIFLPAASASAGLYTRRERGIRGLTRGVA